MAAAQTEAIPRKPLRLWPGVIVAVPLCVVRFVVPIIVPGALFFGVISGLAGALAIVVWWLLLSRTPWAERIGGIVLMALALFATSRLIHISIRTGMMGMMFPIYSIPVVSLALVAGAVASRNLSEGLRRISIAGAILLACGAFTLVRTEGIIGSGGSDLKWRWTKTPEERLLSHAGEEPMARPSAPTVVAHEAQWSGFRGTNRDGIVRGVQIEMDWSRFPPAQLWRRPIGPGWSSFAVHGDLLYTQEQRGDDEIVSCYKLSSGEPVWRHSDAVRFWESNGGAGPRATPALSNGRIYAFGATGILNALDATNGGVVWSRNVSSDAERKVPMWGFASSPLIVGEVVIVAAAARLAGYDLATGKLRWLGPAHGGGYSSPHRATIGGVTQVLLLSSDGATSVAPANGTVLWEHSWAGGAIVQPALTSDGDVLINTIADTGGVGIRRLIVAQGPDGWKVKERWTSAGLKPYFNDFVVHKSHAYGFDGSILACISLEDGTRKWKGGRYGNGQLLLLADQELLLVVSEAGELALVGATPEEFREVARSPGIEGKTWNHPALVGDVLLVRNGQEMAAFRLTLAAR